MLLDDGLKAALCMAANIRSSGFQQRLDGAALVHGLVTLRDLIEGQGEVEDLAGVDLLGPDAVYQVGQETAHGAGPPCRWAWL